MIDIRSSEYSEILSISGRYWESARNGISDVVKNEIPFGWIYHNLPNDYQIYTKNRIVLIKKGSSITISIKHPHTVNIKFEYQGYIRDYQHYNNRINIEIFDNFFQIIPYAEYDFGELIKRDILYLMNMSEEETLLWEIQNSN
ncbi:MAG: hypothetical protein WC284_16505 [Candidimonas sp.]